MKKYLPIALVTVLIGCATSREMTREEMGMVHKAAGPYLQCVKNKALETKDGSDDVKLVVDTAMHNCEDALTSVRQKLAEVGKTDEVFVVTWLRMVRQDVRSFVTEDVLKAKALKKSN